MISAAVRASRITDLVNDTWHIVAVREPEPRNGERDRWRYLIPEREHKLFHEGVAHGDILAPHRRDPDGLVMLAKLARPVVRGRR